MCDQIPALVAEIYNDKVHNVGEPISPSCITNVIQHYSFVVIDETAAVIFDTGSPKTSMFDAFDFIDPICPLYLDSLAGLSKKMQVKGEGRVQWWLCGTQQSTLTLPYNKGSNLPLAHLVQEDNGGVYTRAIFDSVVDEGNVGLTSHEKMLMQWRYKLGHYFFKWIQALMRQGCDGEPLVIITPTNSRAHCCATQGLFCASCQCGKGAWTGSGTKHSVETVPGALKAYNLLLGQKVSVDQYLFKVKG
eukprot:12379950-Ditylum_brightwellii.AAC.4